MQAAGISLHSCLYAARDAVQAGGISQQQVDQAYCNGYVDKYTAGFRFQVNDPDTWHAAGLEREPMHPGQLPLRCCCCSWPSSWAASWCC